MIGLSYYKSLPRKRMGVGALIFNNRREILFVRPTYKDHWSIPGGCIDYNESPRQACEREVREEIGLRIKKFKFLCVDYKYPTKEKTESLQFMFYGGILSTALTGKIKLPQKELNSYKFMTYQKAKPLLNNFTSQRIRLCLRALRQTKAYYLEDTKIVTS